MGSLGTTYHVLLLYPQHVASYYGDTYLSDQILTDNEQDAVKQAKYDCALDNGNHIDWASDFTVLLIVKDGEIL